MPRSAAPVRSLRSGSRTDSFEIISAPPKHPVVRVLALLLRLRAELFVVTVCLTVWFTLRHNLSLAATVTVCIALAVGLAGLPWTRRYLVRRGTAVITRHRLRQTLIECRTMNYSRACPLTLWAHPTRVGENVWLFLRAGISPEDVEGQAAWIAAGCFAREARIVALVSMTALVRVEVIRRDPLAPESIDSDLSPWAIGPDSPIIPVGATPVPPMTTARTAATGSQNGAANGAATAEANGRAVKLVPEPRAEDDTNPDETPRTNGRGGDWSDYV